MSVDGGWLGDPESTPCEMGGGPLVTHPHTCDERGGKTHQQAVRLALQLASGTQVLYAGGDYAAMRARIETILRSAQLFPVAKYMRRFKVHAPKRKYEAGR